jgi:hypothetical protein
MTIIAPILRVFRGRLRARFASPRPFQIFLRLPFPAGASGFLNLSQSGERPDRYRDPRRFKTIPSRPKLPVGIGAVSYHTRAVGPFP